MTLNGFLLPLLLLASSIGFGGGAEDASLHKFHVSTGRLGIENTVVINQTRFFKDDLTEALRAFGNDPDFSLDAAGRSDSLFVAYFNRHFVLRSDGQLLKGWVAGSGEDLEGKEEVWWYVIQYEATKEPARLSIQNTLLTEQFDDQKNILKVQKFPSERSESYFFDGDDTDIEIVF